MLGSSNQITQMQPSTSPGSPAYVGTGSTQLPAMMAAPAATSPLLSALIGAQNTQGQQTQTGSPLGGLPIGLLAQMLAQPTSQTPGPSYTGATGPYGYNTPGGLPVGGGPDQYGGLS